MSSSRSSRSSIPSERSLEAEPAFRPRVSFARVVRLGLTGALSALIILDVLSAWIFLNPFLNPGCPAPEPLTDFPAPQSISLATSDGLSLESWYYPPRNGRAVLALGGTQGALGKRLPPAGFLLESGYGVLQVGSRACAGASVTLGAQEALDAEAGLEFLLSRPEIRPGGIAVFGYSMGGVAAIQAAANRSEIRAVIAEGGFHNLGADFVEPGSDRSPLESILLYTIAGVYQLRTGVDPWLVSPVDAIGSISPRPVLLIYGEGEAASGRAELQFETAGEPKTLWIVPGGSHGTNHVAAGEDYEQRVLDFLEGSLCSGECNQGVH